MSEFWLISIPADPENLQILEQMNIITSKSKLSHNTNFTIPDFKVGTLDCLLSFSDELEKLDVFAENLLKRITHYITEVIEIKKGEVKEYLLASGVTLDFLVTHFEWDTDKYPAKQLMGPAVATLGKQIAQIDSDLKTRSMAYKTIKRNLENLEKKLMGSLFTRTLSHIVNKEDFVLNSKYLVTLLVIVPKASYSKWQKTYECLSDMVVPRSTKLIAEDEECGLFTVTMFQKVIEDFKANAAANKFTVRDIFYDKEKIEKEKEDLSKLLLAKKQQENFQRALKKQSFLSRLLRVIRWEHSSVYQTQHMERVENIMREIENEGNWKGPFLHWLRMNFEELIVAWIHIKVLKVFVESVLRYGLPVNFKAVLLHPQKNSHKRLRKILNSTFKHLDEMAASMMDTPLDVPGFPLNNQDYFPYVYVKIGLGFIE